MFSIALSQATSHHCPSSLLPHFGGRISPKFGGRSSPNLAGSISPKIGWSDPPRAHGKQSCASACHGIEAAVTNQKIQRRPSTPNVRRIGSRELERVLPWTGSKYHCWRRISDPWGCLVRLALSLAGSMLLYDISTLGAAVAFLYWVWGPMWSAALFNSRLRLRYPYAGVWHAKLLMVQMGSSDGSRETLQGIFARSPKLYVTVGDESQVSFQMELPILSTNARSCKIGKHVDVLVLSDCPKLSRFRAIREVYSSEGGAWISEQECINRKNFELSKALFSRSCM